MIAAGAGQPSDVTATGVAPEVDECLARNAGLMKFPIPHGAVRIRTTLSFNTGT